MHNTIQNLFKSASLTEKKETETSRITSNVIHPIVEIISTGTSFSKEKPHKIIRKKDWKEQKLIEKHSKLNETTKGFLNKVLQSPVRATLPQLVGQLNGDRMIGKTPLESTSPHVGTQIADAYLETTDVGSPALSKGMKQLGALVRQMREHTIAPSQLAPELMNCVYKLEEGGSFFIPGMGYEQGYICSIVYEFCKKGEHYDLFVYRIGKEVSGFEEIKYEGNRSWVRPFMHFEKIPSNEIFFTSETDTTLKHDLFQAILESATEKVSTQFSIFSILGHFETYLIPAGQEIKGFLSAAHSHTDAWREFSGIFFRYLGKEQYQKVSFDLKVASLIEGYQLGCELIKEDSEPGAQLREALKAGATTLLNRLINVLLSEELLLQYEATMIDLLYRIEKVEQEIAQERLQKTVQLSFKNEDVREQRTKGLSAAQDRIATCREQKLLSSPSLPRLVDLTKNPSGFLEQLREFNKGFSKNPQIEKCEIEYLVGQLKIPKSPKTGSAFWSEIPENQLAELIQELEILTKHYDLSSRNEKIIAITPKEANTVFTLLVVTHFLVLRLDKRKNNERDGHLSRLASYPLYFPGELFDTDPLLTYTNPLDFKRREGIKSYCKASGEKNTFDPLFHFDHMRQFNNHVTKEGKFGGFFEAFAVKHQLEDLRSTKDPLESSFRIIPHLCPDMQDNLLKKYGFSYVCSLAYASFLAHQFSGYFHLRNEPTGKFQVKMTEYRFGGQLQHCMVDFQSGNKSFGSYEGGNEGKLPNFSSENLYPKLEKESKNVLKNNFALRNRQPDSLNDEAKILASSPSHASLQRAALQPGLQPHRMILDYRQHLDLFVSAEEQTLFELEFFRSVISSQKGFKYSNYSRTDLSERKEWFPLDEELKQPLFVEECQNFIQEGIEHYYDLQLGGRPHVLASLFFIRLGLRLTGFTKKPLINSLDYIHKMLKIKDLTEKERSALSLHLVLAYSQKEQLNDLEIKEIFEAWTYYQNTSLDPEWKSILLEKEAFSFINTLACSKNSEFLEESFQKNLLSEILQLLGLGSLATDFKMAKLSFPIIRADRDTEFWEINLLTGQLTSQLGILARGSIPSWVPKETLSRMNEQENFYNYIFGERSHTYFQMGTTYYFDDSPFLGQMRVVNGNIMGGLQRKIDSKWYQYVPPTALSNYFPHSLIADHTHWVPIDKSQKELLICDFETGDKRALVIESGEIHPYNEESEEFDHTRTLHSAAENAILQKIDQKRYTLCTEKGKQLEKIAFTRFVSLDGEPLFFEMKEGKAFYGLNRKFILCEKQQQGLLGGISDYIVLTDLKGEKEKVLIARRSLGTFIPLTSLHHLSKEGKFDNKKEEFFNPQKGSATFLEYDLKGGKLIPLSTESALQLAYFYQAQRDYVKAKEILEKIPHKKALSSISCEILCDIINLCENGHDTSPESAAVSLWAYHLGNKVAKRHSAVSLPQPSRAYSIYNRYSETIPSALEFHGKREKAIGENNKERLSSSVEGTIDQLKVKALPHPKAGFPYVEHWESTDYQKNWNYISAGEQTKFLHWSEGSNYEAPRNTLCTQFDKGYATKNFFRTAYEIALHGSEAAKKRLAFRLELMEGMRLQSGNLFDRKERPTAWTILQFALRYPNEIPKELPPPPKNPEQLLVGEVRSAWDFLLKMEQLIGNKKFEGKKKEAILVQDPLPLSKQFKTVFPEKKRFKPVEERLSLELSGKEVIDEGFLSELFSEHLEESFSTIQSEKKEKASPITYDPTLAQSVDEKSAINAIKKEFEEFAKGFVKGGDLNREKKVYKGKDLFSLKEKLETKNEDLSVDLHNLESAILELANAKEEKSEKNFSLLCESKVEQELSLKKLFWHFLGQDKAAFKKANPYLSNPDFEKMLAHKLGIENKEGVALDYLYNLIGLYLTTAVYKQRLERAQGHVSKMLKTEVSEFEKEDLIQKLASELNPETLNSYDVQKNPGFLIFEYFSKFSIRPDQNELLDSFLDWDENKNQYHNKLKPLRPGGGKTAVVAVIRMKMAASRGKLPLFCTTSPQYASVAENLRKTLKECFDQDMEEIEDISFDDIYSKVEVIEKRLEKAWKRGDFLPIKSEMLLCLQLKLISAAFAGVGTPSNQLREINALRRILRLIRGTGELLIDEIDLVLHILKEMNFPQGEKKHVSPDRIDLLRELFLLFVSENARVDEENIINLKEMIKLEENRQTLLSESDFKGVVAKCVAWKFAKESDRLLLNHNPNFTLSFYRYISGNMNTDCQKVLDDPNAEWEQSEQDSKDLEFLKYVRKLSESPISEEVEAAHQIALVKRMMRTVLPTTFQKMVNRHYGRGKDKPGEVRPFEGKLPTRNYFGYIYEWIAYHFQTVLQAGMGKEQITLLASIYREGASTSLKAHQIEEDEETGNRIAPEAIEFKKLTGISLEEVENPQKLETAVKNVNQSVEAKLQLEAETASDQVIYHSKRLSGNGFSLANMSNPNGMSGTLNNAHCFEDCLADNYEPKPEIIGQIADLVVGRIESQKKKHLHFVRTRTLEGILEKTLKEHPEKDRIRLLLDAGALFKDYTNLEVAEALRLYLNKPILFFEGDILTLLPLDSDNLKPIRSGTRIEDIEKTGVGIDDYACYIDEAHGTGTDLPLPYDALGVMTVDETILDRAVWQNILRLRLIAFKQGIEFIIPIDILPLLLHALKNDPALSKILENDQELKEKLKSDEYLTNLIENVTEYKLFCSLLGRALLNQAIAKGKEYGRSRKQKIDSLFEQVLLVDHLLLDRDLKQEDLDKLGPFKNVLELPQEDSPYDQDGALDVQVDSIHDLIAYGNRRLELFKKAGGKEEEVKKLSEEIKKVIEKAAKSPWLLKTTPSPGVSELGMEVDILNEVTKNVNVDQEINQELLQELQIYETSQGLRYRPEKVWEENEMETFLKEVSKGEKSKSISPLTEVMAGYGNPNEKTPYKKPYNTLFTDSIQGTSSWIFTTNLYLPVFHQMQRPAENILLVEREGKYQAILLSSSEANQFKYFLREQYKKNNFSNISLVQPDLSFLEVNPSGGPANHIVSDLLFQVNVFNGNLAYLEEHTEETQEWLKQDRDLKLSFLQLRVARNTALKKRLFESPLFGGQKASKRKVASSLLREKIAKLSKEAIQKLGEDDKKTLGLLSKHQLCMLLPEQVPLLRRSQMSYLRDRALVQAIPENHKKNIVPQQFSYLTETQKGWFKENELSSTTKEEVVEEERLISSPRIFRSFEAILTTLPNIIHEVIPVPTLETPSSLAQIKFTPTFIRKEQKTEIEEDSPLSSPIISPRNKAPNSTFSVTHTGGDEDEEEGIYTDEDETSSEFDEFTLKAKYTAYNEEEDEEEEEESEKIKTKKPMSSLIPKLTFENEHVSFGASRFEVDDDSQEDKTSSVEKLEEKETITESPQERFGEETAHTVTHPTLLAGENSTNLIESVEAIPEVLLEENPNTNEIFQLQQHFENPLEQVDMNVPELAGENHLNLSRDVPQEENQIDNAVTGNDALQRVIVEVREGDVDPQVLTCCQITTRIALVAIGLIAIIATIAGIFATIGLHASWAPKFMVTLANGLPVNFAAYILTAAGPTYLFGLGIYFILRRRQAIPIRV